MIEQKPIDTPGYTLGDHQVFLVREGKVIGLVTQEYADEVAPRPSAEEIDQPTSQQGINQAPQPDLNPEGALREPRRFGNQSQTEAAELAGDPRRQGAPLGADARADDPKREEEARAAEARNEALGEEERKSLSEEERVGNEGEGINKI